ncbi:hypothetical protein D8674_014546 [Pyrus ussuriensis x Pyrus communis]|uniref:Uncharacterized protein n=1 Tax=Pyrus ussuriensis x Pyrus communis TaxID=2448454 RepID=A0A5N5GU46_9ROSA|nr:hypothetical protein D8674_014546 [Pyrus ussuriensis x Pyrus communis]
MHRSPSSARASEEFLVNFLPASLSLASTPLLKTAAASGDLPAYSIENSDHATKKEIGLLHNSSGGENAIHLIPVILFLCGFVLRIFSHPTKL